LQRIYFPNVQYARAQYIDKIYENHVRVTLDVEKKNKILECTQKEKRNERNIVFPHCNYDFRISSSMEHIVPKPTDNLKIELIRAKDRISYKWDIFRIDMSIIHTYNSNLTNDFGEQLRLCFNQKQQLPTNHGCEMSYEVELEIIDRKWIRNQIRLRDEKKKENQFEFAITSFVNHVINLCTSATDVNYMPPVCRLPNQPSR